MIKTKSCKISCRVNNKSILKLCGYSPSHNPNKRREVLNKAVSRYGKIEVIRRLYQLKSTQRDKKIIKDDINYLDLMYFIS